MLFRSDRKSTRLKSSHTIISYAVFCLKKKRKSTRHGRTPRQHGSSPALTASGQPRRRGGARGRGRRGGGSGSAGRGATGFFVNGTPAAGISPLPLHGPLPG